MEYYKIGKLAQIKEQTRTNRSVDNLFQFHSSLHITAKPPSPGPVYTSPHRKKVSKLTNERETLPCYSTKPRCEFLRRVS